MNSMFVSYIITETENWFREIMEENVEKLAFEFESAKEVKAWFKQMSESYAEFESLKLTIIPNSNVVQLSNSVGKTMEYPLDDVLGDLKNLRVFLYRLIEHFQIQSEVGTAHESGYTGESLPDAHISVLNAMVKLERLITLKSDSLSNELSNELDSILEYVLQAKQHLDGVIFEEMD